MNFLNSIHNDWSLKNEWIDVKRTKNGPELIRERKTWGKRLVYQILSLATLGLWKKRHGIERVIKEMQKIAENHNTPAIPIHLQLGCLERLSWSRALRNQDDLLSRVAQVAENTLFETSKKRIQELSDPSLDPKKRIDAIRNLDINFEYLSEETLAGFESVAWSDAPCEEEKLFLCKCYGILHKRNLPSMKATLILLEKKAVSFEDPEALYNVGKQFKSSDGTHETESLPYLMKAAVLGHHKALDDLKTKYLWWYGDSKYTLGNFFAELSAHQDLELCFEYFREAFILGNQKAFEKLENWENSLLPDELQLKRHYALGSMYPTGNVSEKTLRKATDYLKKISKQDLSGVEEANTYTHGPAFQKLVNIARLIDQAGVLTAETAKELFTKCLAKSKKISNCGLRMEAYALCKEIPVEKDAPWKITLGKNSFEPNFEEKMILLDLSKVVQSDQEGAWKIPEENTIDLSQKPGLTEENLKRFLKSLKTGHIQEVEEAIEHVLIAEELQIPPIESASKILQDAIIALNITSTDDHESAIALTECVKSVQFPLNVTTQLAAYWACVFRNSKSPSERMEIIQTLQHIHPENLRIDGPLSDEEVAQIIDIRGLKYLTLSGYEGGKELEKIKRVENLTQLTLGKCENISDEVLNSIAQLKNLEWLSFEKCTFSAQKGLKTLGSLEKLSWLLLGSSAPTLGISALKNFYLLVLWNIEERSSEEIKEIGSLKDLKELRLKGSSVSDSVIKVLGQWEFPKLSIILGNTAISEEALKSLKLLKPEWHVIQWT